MLLWISGQSGAGKTTLGQNLSEKYGFAHFDGDTYYCGGDPIADSGAFIGREKSSDELKKQWSIIEKNYGLLFGGEDLSVEDWIPALEGLCASVVEKSKEHEDMAVTFSLYTRDVRKWVGERIEKLLKEQGYDRKAEGIKFVVLNDIGGAAAKRKLAQVKAAASAQGMTMDEFVGQYGKEWKGDEETLKELAISQRGFEPGNENSGEYDIVIAENESSKDVLDKVAIILGLTRATK